MTSISTAALPYSDRLRSVLPGLLVSSLLAVAAQFAADQYGAPAMLMALLFGIAFHFLASDGQCVDGVHFAASTVLRLGVALLGARISIDLLSLLDTRLICLVALAVLCTIIYGLIGSRLIGRTWQFGLLTGGAVAICGASAAVAISAVLPRNEHSESNLLFTILSVTILSTVAMIIYPPLSQLLNLDDPTAGFFLGGTIHDVAQVVGAGFSVSEQTGEVATMVKLIRVSMLAPFVLLISVFVRVHARAYPGEDGKHPPLVPAFVIGFFGLAAANSFGYLPGILVDLLNSLSGWALLIAISAVGMKTSPRNVLNLGGTAIMLILAETVFIAAFVLGGIAYQPS